MHDVSIPDPLYAEALRAAAANGKSVERLVKEAVELYLGDMDEPESLHLTQEQVAIIRKGQAEIEAGDYLTMDQLKADLAENRASWMKENRP